MQSNEVKSSSHMEKEGLTRAVDFLHSNGFEIQTLVTDRHSQIAKWVREKMPETAHRYDIWHLAKCELEELVVILLKFILCTLQTWIYSIEEKP